MEDYLEFVAVGGVANLAERGGLVLEVDPEFASGALGELGIEVDSSVVFVVDDGVGPGVAFWVDPHGF